MAAAGWGDDDWEAIDNDGFVYKRKKRHCPDPPATSSATGSAADPTAEDKSRRRRRRNALLKVRERYQSEIAQWELLSNTLRAFEEKAQNRERLLEEPSTSMAAENREVEEREGAADSVLRRRIDDLALRAEADHAIIEGISNLCDMAEAICNAEEQCLKKECLDLPLWASPREMMAVLCDTSSESDNGGGDIKSV